MRLALLLLVGCGRIDFDAHRDAAVTTDATPQITYAQTVVGQSFSGSVDSFSFTPMKTRRRRTAPARMFRERRCTVGHDCCTRLDVRPHRCVEVRSPAVRAGPGYTKGADDGGDWTELKLTSDPAGTDENASFSNSPSQGFTIGVVSVKAS